MTGSVMTVLGSVEASRLGHVQPHEHVFVDITWTDRRWDLVLLEDVDQMTEEVRRFGDAGGGTLVDVTCRGIGRKPDALRQVSEQTGVHIVMGTGWYRAPYYPTMINETSTARLAGMLIDEIENGAEETGIRPGIIGEIGSDKRWIQGTEERVFRAAARAHAASGLAISTHTPPHTAAAQLEILFEEGADPSKVVIGHCDNTLEFDYLTSILRRGVTVQFDLIGIESINTDARRADMVQRLIHAGYLEQLLLSLDLCSRTRLATNGGTGYAHLRECFLPLLRERNVSEEEIDTLTKRNPQRLLQV